MASASSLPLARLGLRRRADSSGSAYLVDDDARRRAAPAASRSRTPSAVSCTGISSSRVTRCTAVSFEPMTAMTASACERIGPVRASPATSVLTLRNRAIRPVGGASITTAS